MGSMRITPIAWTSFDGVTASELVGWEPDQVNKMADGSYDAAALAEFAGRACYASWHKPNPATATNEGYLEHIIDVGHFSVVEHGSVTFYIDGVSRSLTHELIRHRHHSYSQLSQRYVVAKPGDRPVTPPLFYANPDAAVILSTLWNAAVQSYDALVRLAESALMREGVDPATARKEAREAARSVLPNMTPTAIVVTGNHRAWREFVQKRAILAADAEIRIAACTIFGILNEMYPALYQDMALATDGRGREYIVYTENE